MAWRSYTRHTQKQKLSNVISESNCELSKMPGSYGIECGWKDSRTEQEQSIARSIRRLGASMAHADTPVEYSHWAPYGRGKTPQRCRPLSLSIAGASPVCAVCSPS
jgi:hypothetical protein